MLGVQGEASVRGDGGLPVVDGTVSRWAAASAGRVRGFFFVVCYGIRLGSACSWMSECVAGTRSLWRRLHCVWTREE